MDALLLVHDAGRNPARQAAGQQEEIAQGVVQSASGRAQNGDARSTPFQGQLQGQFQVRGVFLGGMKVHFDPRAFVVREQRLGDGVHVANSQMRQHPQGFKMSAAAIDADQTFGGGDHGPDFGRKFKGAVGQENPVHHFSAV